MLNLMFEKARESEVVGGLKYGKEKKLVTAFLHGIGEHYVS